MGLLNTAANLNEITNLGEVLNTLEIERGTSVMADNGDQSKKTENYSSAENSRTRS
jgi:hypothetical protein